MRSLLTSIVYLGYRNRSTMVRRELNRGCGFARVPFGKDSPPDRVPLPAYGRAMLLPYVHPYSRQRDCARPNLHWRRFLVRSKQKGPGSCRFDEAPCVGRTHTTARSDPAVLVHPLLKQGAKRTEAASRRVSDDDPAQGSEEHLNAAS